MTTTNTLPSKRIPLWISVLQVLLIGIMMTQVYEFYLDHEAVRASGITIETVADRRLAYEFAARTLTMALVSAAIVASQRVELFMAMFLMNLLREGQETIIDPLFPTANAAGLSPTADFVMHLVIVGVQAFALFRLYTLWRDPAHEQASGAIEVPQA